MSVFTCQKGVAASLSVEPHGMLMAKHMAFGLQED